MPIIVPILVGYAANVIIIIIWKGNMVLDKRLYQALRNKPRAALFFLKFLTVPNCIATGLGCYFFPIIRLGMIGNSLIFVGVVAVEIMVSEVSAAASQAFEW